MACPVVDEPLVGQRQPKIFYYEADGLGSVTSLTDPTGAVAATYTYDSFGFMTASTGSATNWFRYSARQFDSDTALYYNRARYYDPTTGRFLSEDPIGFKGGINFYAYVRGNPVGRTDPLGLCDQKPSCNTFLPNGQTIGQVVRNAVATIHLVASYDLSGLAELNAFYATVKSNGPIDFKKHFGPDPTGALGAAGNFAYGAIASGIGYSQSFAEFGAGVYAAHAGKSNPNNPHGEDNSAAQNLPAGYATVGCTH
jgi:RHS repeat-associated protein